jgi:hypothetical protein
VSAGERGERAAGSAEATATAQSSASVPERNVYFGELHLHTSWSFDAYSFQNTVVDPDAAYRYAKGEAIRHMNGEMVRRNTPLDFAAVTDHAEYLGVAQLLADPNHPLYQKQVAAKLRSKDPKEGMEAYLELAGAIAGQRKADDDLIDPKTVGSIWKRRRSSPSSTTHQASSPPSSRSSGARRPTTPTCIAT